MRVEAALAIMRALRVRTVAGGELHDSLLMRTVCRTSGVYSECLRLSLCLYSSTLSRDTTKAPQSVLIVKQHPSGEPGAPRWRRILVATSDSAWSDAAVEHAVRLAHAEQLEVSFLHVAWTRGPRVDTPAVLAGHESLVRAAARAAAAGLVSDATLGVGEIVRAILDTAATKQCDAIVMGCRGLTGWKRLMLGSIAGAVAATTVLPVLIVKHGEPTARTDGGATGIPHEL